MRRGILYGVLGLASLMVTFMLLAGVVEAMLRYSVPDMRMVQFQFQEQMPVVQGAQEEFVRQVRFYVFALKSLWILWLVPVIGALLFAWGVARLKRGGEKRLLEHVYFLEQNLDRVTKFELEARQGLDDVQTGILAAYEQASEVFLLVSDEGTIEHLNVGASRLFGRWHNRQEQFVRRLVKDVIPGYESSDLAGVVRDAFQQGKTWCGEVQLPAAKAWLDVRAFMMGPSCTLVMKETTHLHQSDQQHKLGLALLMQLLKSSPNMIAVLDSQFRIIQLSAGWCKLFQLEAGHVEGKLYEAVVQSFPPQWGVLKNQLKDGKTLQMDEISARLHGEEVWLKMKGQPWLTDDGTVGGYMLFLRDITNAKLAGQRLTQLEEQENKLAYHDLLTGLPNRQLFYDRLNMALAMAYRQLNKVGLMFLDLDGFKAVNDTLGHDVGDMLLKAVSERLKTCVRQVDTVSRLGGDEFTVIANVQDANDCALIADKIIESVNKPFDLGDHKGVRIGTSIGIAMYPADGGAANELIRKADIAMYVSKKGGKNQYHFYEPGMEPSAAATEQKGDADDA